MAMRHILLEKPKKQQQQKFWEAFISTFYTSHLTPKEIYVSEQLENKDFLEDALAVKIDTFSKGNKFKLIENAKKNALAAIERRLAENKSILSNLKEMKPVLTCSDYRSASRFMITPIIREHTPSAQWWLLHQKDLIKNRIGHLISRTPKLPTTTLQ